MNLEKNIQYLDNIRDKIDSTMSRGRISKIPESFIGDNLARAFDDGKRFTVSYIKLSHSDPVFIMACYPDIDELNAKSELLMKGVNNQDISELIKEWNTIRRWHIEIDERLLTPKTPITVDNGSQFVAILCHELGHILSTFPMYLTTSYHMHVAQGRRFQKMISTDCGRTILKLCMPMFICASGLKLIISRPGAELTEYVADAMVPKVYKPYLIEYAHNHIISNPSAKGIITTPEEYMNEEATKVEFSRNCIDLMKRRTILLKTQVETFGVLSPSPYMQKFAKFLRNSILPDDPRQEYTALESFNRDWERATIENERYVMRLCEGVSVSERDLLLLQVDIDGMKNLDDKAYVLNTICDFIEALEKKRAKEIKKAKDITKIPVNKEYEDKLRRLQQMKQQVIDTKITTYDRDNVFRIQVKYPDGYEG